MPGKWKLRRGKAVNKMGDKNPKKAPKKKGGEKTGAATAKKK